MPSLPQPCWRDNSRTSQSVSEPAVVTPMRLPLRSATVFTGVSNGSASARLAGGPYMAATPSESAPLARKPSPGPEPRPTSRLPAVSPCCSCASPRNAITSISMPSCAKIFASEPTSAALKANEFGTALPRRTLSSAWAAPAAATSAASARATMPHLETLNMNAPPAICFSRNRSRHQSRRLRRLHIGIEAAARIHFGTHEAADALDRAARLRDDPGEHLPDMRHARPDLELNAATGGAQLVGHPHRVIAQDFVAAHLNQRGRQADRIAVE